MTRGTVVALVAVFAAGAAAGAAASQRRPRAGVCAYRQMQCLIFWKKGGKEFMGGAVEPCDFAREYAESGNRTQGKGTYWVREAAVNIDVDLASQCLSPEAAAAEAKGVPAMKATRADGR